MSERSKVSVLKTDVLRNTGGSNPSPSEPWRRVWGELRGRAGGVLGGLALSAGMAYLQGEALLALYLGTLPAPLPPVLFLHPTEALRTHLSLALHLALLLHLPLLGYVALCFLRPSLYAEEAQRATRWVRWGLLAWASSFPLVGGVLWPLVGHLALHFQGEALHFQPRLAALQGAGARAQVVGLLLCFALPLGMAALHRAQVPPRGRLWLGAALGSALCCPPEMGLQALATLGVGGWLEVGLWGSRVSRRRAAKCDPP
uniref:SecY-independent transporter protein n=1 Tax=Picocystis salinarum TaxID=88271 RepID=A0A4D6C4A2_9CHLO|nr:SecY-independent transporter protein [Picocystis salinarum]QBX98522.1 SecY-independent transporter protein [Picocystis salinarum]